MDLWSKLREADFSPTLSGAIPQTRPAALIAGMVLSVSLSATLPGTPCRAEAAQSTVATAEVQPQAYQLTLPDKIGVLLAGKQQALAFEDGGRLESIARSGSDVRAADLVASLNASLERARLEKAELELAQASTEWRRVQELHGKAAASLQTLDRADTKLRIRRAERDIAAEQLARRNLFAPFQGLVVDSQPELGEVVKPGVRVATLMSLNPLRLEVGVPGYQIGLVKRGAAVSITFPALSGEAFDAVVERVAPAAIEAGHLFEVEIRIENPDGRLRPGMSARAQIVTQTLDDVLSVPLDLVVERNSRRVVFFVSDHRARAVDVSDAPIHRDRVLIPSSIAWRTLVLRGQRDLRDFGPVHVDNTVLEGDRGA